MTDTDFLLEALGDGGWHSLNELLQRSFRDRGCGLTVHSRAADLRRQGYGVEHRSVRGAHRGAASEYRLVPPEPAPEPVREPEEPVGEPEALTIWGELE